MLAPVDRPILGWDFLVHFKLWIDAPGARLLDSANMTPLCVVSGDSGDAAVVAAVAVPPPLSDLLSEYSDIMGTGFSDIRPTHGVFHHVVTSGPPVHARARRLDPVKLTSARAEFLKMEEAGIIRRSCSPWASPLHMVPKPDGSWRPCGDYRALNLATIPDSYPLPYLADFSAQLHGRAVFSKLDLLKGYYQIPMNPADVPKTSVVTPFGAFEWLFMPFGLRNAAQTFQRSMDRLVSDLDFAFVYLDDILVASVDLDQHLVHLRILLDRLRDNGFKINSDKCLFAQPTVPFLGHSVSVAGVAPLARHLDTISDFEPPTDIAGLQRFLGLLNFYRRFIPGAAGLLRPLTDALRASARPFTWTAAMDAAFLAAKSALAAACALQHPVPGARLSLAVDASDSHVGAALQQFVGGSWAPMAFFSRKLSPAELNYSTFDRELLSAYSAIRHFRHMLEGRQFTLFTDHKPLVHALRRVSPPASARQQRHLSYISEYTTDLQYLPGSANVVADALSRPTPVSALVADADFVAAQLNCPDCTALSKSERFDVRPSGGGGALVSHAAPSPRLLVPLSHRRQAYEEVHNVAHPGTRATRRLLTNKFLWPGMKKDISLWVKQCPQCQTSKVNRHQRPKFDQIPVPQRRFHHIHVDLVGPLKQVDGFTHIFTMVDRTTRWAEAVPVKDISAATCVKVLVNHWISRFGVPSVLTSDLGTQFTSATWVEACTKFGIRCQTTTPYHPESNGMVERFHRRLKDALRARSASSDWPDQLPLILLGLRSAPAEESGVSSAELVFGSTPSLPSSFLDQRPEAGEMFFKGLQRILLRLPPTPTRPSPAPVWVDPALHTATHVYVRRDGHVPSLEPLYNGPFLVLEKKEKVFILEIGQRRCPINIARLKTVHSPGEVSVQQPPKRGRPPRASPPGRSARPSAPSGASPALPSSLPARRRRGRPPNLPTSLPVLQPPPSLPRRPGLRPRGRAGGWGGAVTPLTADCTTPPTGSTSQHSCL